MAPAAGARRRVLFRLATSDRFDRAVRRWPALRARATASARRYVAGEEAGDALAVARRLAEAGMAASIDLFGQRLTGGGGAVAAVVRDYEALAARVAAEAPAETWLSVDLSHVAFDDAALERIAAAVPEGARLQVGAEELAVTGRVQAAVRRAAARGLPVEATLQANLRRSAGDAEALAAAGVPVRLVKGAYVETGADALPWGPPADAAYVGLAHRLTAAGADVALATHDGALLDRLLPDFPQARVEHLLGIHPARVAALAAAGRSVRIYVPYGPDWLRYFMRLRAEAQQG